MSNDSKVTEGDRGVACCLWAGLSSGSELEAVQRRCRGAEGGNGAGESRQRVPCDFTGQVKGRATSPEGHGELLKRKTIDLPQISLIGDNIGGQKTV